MSDLSAFLLARITEDEDLARGYEGLGGMPDPWELDVYHDRDRDAPMTLTIEPERVLAECDAKRRIIEDFEHLDDMRPGAIRAHSEFVLRLLAVPFADHPDYDETWRP